MCGAPTSISVHKLFAIVFAAGCGTPAALGVRADVVDAGDDAAATCGTAVAAQVVAGEQFSCARMTDGTARCWGGGFAHQLGDGLATHERCYPSPGGPNYFDCSPRPVD